MREVKFRGMDIVNNKWLYGNLEISLINRSKSKHFIIGYSYGQYQKHEVDPKTVGQYTGLKDKNGTEIYEGDIVDCLTSGLSVVKFNRVSFVLENKEIEISFYECYGLMEVIGNIYENPELLEGKE